MPSNALNRWKTVSKVALDEIESAHKKVGGPQRGRRTTTQRLVHAEVVVLAAQWQRYVRDLHNEAFLWLLGQYGLPRDVETALYAAATAGRALAKGNATRSNIAEDFKALHPRLWDAVLALDPRNAARLQKLDLVNEWRNAIAHDDFTKRNASSERLHLAAVKTWRRACDRLAHAVDLAVRDSLGGLVGHKPW